MSIDRRRFTAILGLALAGCRAAGTASPEQARGALAPQGTLRVGFLSGVLYATPDPATGEPKGVAVDLGRELARRADLPFRAVPYPNPGALLAGAPAGEWDVALMGVTPERATVVDFTAPCMEVEQGYLVAPGVPVAAMSEIDRPGLRLAVVERSGADTYHSKTLKHATLVRTKTLDELAAALDAGRADAIAATKTHLAGTASRRPGTRVLDGRFLVEPIAMAVPKGRDPLAADHVGRFVESAKAEGRVKAAIERAGLRGVAVAPPK
jgi:polar amino acid transport system substrate-binding protein